MRRWRRRWTRVGGHGHHDFVTLVVVPLWRSQLVRAALEDHGVECQVIDSFNLATQGLTDARIQVRRSDVDRARRILSSIEGA